MGMAFIAVCAAASPTPATDAPQGRVDLSKYLTKRSAAAALPAAPVTAQSKVTPKPLQAPARTVTRSEEVINEDFSLVPDGEIDPATGRPVTYIASHYFEPGRYVNPEYVHGSGTWEGNDVMAGQNGTVIIQARNPQSKGYLNTPLGDYSGDLTITMRMRFATAWWATADPDVWNHAQGSIPTVYLLKGGFDQPSVADCDYPRGQQTTLYEKSGWVTVTYTFHNESSDADGFIQIQCAQAVEIDYITVTDADTYLACPVARGVTDFREDGFTINWDPVRRAGNYYIDLWQKTYTAPSGVDQLYDFEDGELPEGTACESYEIRPGQGRGSSTGLWLPDGSSFETKSYELALDEANVDFLPSFPEGCQGYVSVDGLTEDGWVPFGYVSMWAITPNVYNTLVIPDTQIAGRYTALRFYTTDFGEGYGMTIDNVRLMADRPYRLQRVDKRGQLGGYADEEDLEHTGYTYYDFTTSGIECTSYTFTGLDSETEYFYRVRSHYMKDFSSGTINHAFGVSKPHDLSADNINGGEYTAHWADVAKAQQYIVTNYETQTVKEDTPEFIIMDEDFSNAEGEDDVNDLTLLDDSGERVSLDEYTDCKGWTATFPACGNSMLGSRGGNIYTPPLYAVPGRENIALYVTIYGTAGDQIPVNVGSGFLFIPIDDNGMAYGKISIPALEPGQQMYFCSYNGLDFALSAVQLVQDLCEGDVAMRWESQQVVPAGVGSCTFTGLDENGTYAFNAVSSFRHDRQTVLSEASEMVNIDMATRSQVGMADQKAILGAPVHEVARYAIDGTPVTEGHRGVVIVKMSDGTAHKAAVR